jgi:hypothetical protein
VPNPPLCAVSIITLVGILPLLQHSFKLAVLISKHNKDEYSDISKSFLPKSELEKALQALTGKKPTTLKITQGKFVVEPVCPKFIYVTLTKPHHPGKFKEYKDLLVIAAQEVWCPK